MSAAVYKPFLFPWQITVWISPTGSLNHKNRCFFPLLFRWWLLWSPGYSLAILFPSSSLPATLPSKGYLVFFSTECLSLVWVISVILYVVTLPCPLFLLFPLKHLTSCPPSLGSSFIFFFLLLPFSLFSFCILPSLTHPFPLNSFPTEACQTTFLFSFKLLLKPHLLHKTC